MQVQQLQTGRVVMGRMQRGDDLLATLTQVCREHNIRLGMVQGLGAVEYATIAYYDQNKQVYQELKLDQHLEILSLTGNVSLRDGEVALHLHATFGDEAGKATGGHVGPDTRIFACEFTIQELTGGEFHRGLDQPTGLPLWD